MATERYLSIHEVLAEVNARLRAYGLIQDESQELTRRTFQYYRSRDLLPDPEGVGPKARYPWSVLHRVVAIRRLQKERPELSLDMIATILAAISEKTIMAVAAGKEPLVIGDVEMREALLSSAGEFGGDEAGDEQNPFGRAGMTGDDLEPPDVRLARSSARAKYARRMSAPKKLASRADSETFQRIPLTDDVELNVRRRLSRKQLEQLGIIGELIKSILKGGDK